MADFMTDYLAESTAAMQAFAADQACHAAMRAMADAICTSLRAGGKLMIAGNGGSAGDAQHIAGEFVARMMYDRAPLAAIALTTDTSVLTATANDYGYDHIFERQVRALGRPGDLFLGISTSGKSKNILAAMDAGRAQGVESLAFCGPGTEALEPRCKAILAVPSSRTPVIQQLHIVAAHIVCTLVEAEMFPKM
jgi:D-sedoheptulose 7-phosphate isomerase